MLANLSEVVGKFRFIGGVLQLFKGAARRLRLERLADRAQHVALLAEAAPDFAGVAVLRFATGATMRQDCTAADSDPSVQVVGIPAAAF